MMAADLPDRLQIDVLPHLGEAGPVAYGAVAAGEGARELLAARLLEGLGARVPAWTGALAWGELTLMAGPLGRPLLKLGGKPGPGLSFSEAGGTLWGAMVAAGQAGVDAALEQDFQAPYPYSRAFRREEWDWAWRHCQGRAPAAAALLWAAKEAAVKALGSGFHTVDPLDLEVVRLEPGLGGARAYGPGCRAGERLGPGPAGWLAGPGRGLNCRWSNHRAQRRLRSGRQVFLKQTENISYGSLSVRLYSRGVRAGLLCQYRHEQGGPGRLFGQVA